MKNIKHTYFLTLCHIFFFLYLTVSISGNSTAPYTPTDNITLDCGSIIDSEAQDRRNWSGDIGSKFGPSEQSNNASVIQRALRQGTSVDEVPYMTARISRSQFTYTFPVTAGQKFIRLYFYPALYPPGFETSKAFFSVKAGPYTLLSNFSPSLTADSLGSEYFLKEFCINVEDNQQLNITFAPSTPPSDDVYGFINGIEIVSMPTNLYYTSSSDTGIPFIGQHYHFSIDNNTALEMVYRLNVGGSSVPPMKDSGMFRLWSNDDDYLLKKGVLPVNTRIKINYTEKTPPYTAPEQIYWTARSMGMNKRHNYGYNLTWKLPVDSGFKYLVRLHFCEFEPDITDLWDRVFSIYINNQTAEVSADIIRWSGGNGIPVYKDYLVWIEGQVLDGKRDLFIALHPKVESMTTYSDAILNGLEVFKLSNYDRNLAGPNPEPRVPPGPAEPSRPTAKKSKTNKTVFIAVGGSVMVMLAILFVLCYTIFWRVRKTKDHGSYCGPSWWCWWDPYKAKSSRTKASSLPEELCRYFSVAEIRTATNNFDDNLIIGEGGFGNVYKGHIDGGDTMVAIKRLNPGSRQGASEFKTEIEMLSQLRHLHLVSLIGYCNDEREMILVYDYMTNGTLRDHLYETDKDPLPWKKRLEICIGAAKGLHYLHACVKHTIIHRDVKSTNILLDENWVAKVSDFGLSKMGQTSIPNTAVTTLVKGTWGYLDPEYIRRQQLTEKSDVYSFGVVLFEVLCARKAVNHKLDEDQVNLAHWAQNCIRNRTLDQIIDPYLMGNIAPFCLKKFVAVAESCLRDNGIERPTMGDVVGSLEFALQLQESTDASKEDFDFGGGARNEYIYEEISSGTAITSAHNDAVSLQGGRGLDWSTSGFTMVTSTSGLSFPSSDSDTVKSGEIS